MGELIKTSRKLCSRCIYHFNLGGASVGCEYIVRTGKDRGCKVGECDKFSNCCKKKK